MNQHRKRICQQRSSLPAKILLQNSDAVFEQLITLPQFETATTVASYCASRGEILTDRIHQYCWQQGKKLYLPRILANFEMEFCLVKENSILTMNRFNIPEPNNTDKRVIAPKAIDIALLPLVAFDEQGHRVGMGCGYYDRYFQFARVETLFKRPWLIGLAHGFQQLEMFNNQPWDVSLDSIITESDIKIPQKKW